MLALEEKNSEGSVAIMAKEQSDATLVATLLENFGLDSQSVCIADPQQLSNCQTFAVVVCHRQQQEPTDAFRFESVDTSRLIVLTDCTAETTVVNLLEKGARHVFNLHEPVVVLQARLEAALRQHRGMHHTCFTVDDIHFDIQKRKVFRAGEAIDLSPKEFEFASRIFNNVDKVVKNSELMTSVWSLPQHMDTRRIDTAACRVRKKLRLFSDEGWLLKRIRCVGYRLTRVKPEGSS